MITIKFNGEEYQLKQNLNEVNIGEFEQICYILGKELSPTDKVISIMVMLGIPEYIIDEMDIIDFQNIVQELEYDSLDTELLPQFNYNGIDYINHPTDFKLTVKNNILIEEYIYNDSINYMGEILAILYPPKNGLNTKEEIKKRAELFRTFPAIYIIPIIFYISKIKNV